MELVLYPTSSEQTLQPGSMPAAELQVGRCRSGVSARAFGQCPQGCQLAPTAGRSEATAESAVRNAPRSSSSSFPTPSRKIPPGKDIQRSDAARQALPASVGCSVAHPSRQSRVNLHNADGVGRRGRVRCARLSRPSSQKAWSRA